MAVGEGGNEDRPLGRELCHEAHCKIQGKLVELSIRCSCNSFQIKPDGGFSFVSCRLLWEDASLFLNGNSRSRRNTVSSSLYLERSVLTTCCSAHLRTSAVIIIMQNRYFIANVKHYYFNCSFASQRSRSRVGVLDLRSWIVWENVTGDRNRNGEEEAALRLTLISLLCCSMLRDSFICDGA